MTRCQIQQALDFLLNSKKLLLICDGTIWEKRFVNIAGLVRWMLPLMSFSYLLQPFSFCSVLNPFRRSQKNGCKCVKHYQKLYRSHIGKTSDYWLSPAIGFRSWRRWLKSLKPPITLSARNMYSAYEVRKLMDGQSFK